MIKKLAEFGYVRSPLEAVGFYVVWLIVLMVSAGLVAMAIGSIILGSAATPEDSLVTGIRIGTVIGVLFSVMLSMLIAHRKKLLQDMVTLLLIVASGLVATFGGGLLGMIIPAYLSTRPIKGTTMANDVASSVSGTSSSEPASNA